MKKKKKIYWSLILCIIIAAVVFPFSVTQMRDTLLKSGQSMGAEVASKYGAKEEMYTEQYEYLLNLLEYQLRPGNTIVDTEQFMKNFLNMADETMNLTGLEIYSYIDGEIAAATPWEDDVSYHVEETDWYQGALRTDGIYYTDVYEDVRLKTEVVTLAKRIEGTENVVAADLYPENMADSILEDLPDQSHYFLSDGEGTLLNWHVTRKDLSKEEIQNRYLGFFHDIKAGKHASYDSPIEGMDGKQRGVYYFELDNGWYSVITIPFDQLLEPLKESWGMFLLVMMFFIILLIAFLLLEYRANKKARLYNDIVRVLGNSYYALYMIDLNQNQYFMLKGSDYVRERLPQKGSYDALLDILKEIVEDDTYQQFREAFARDNMFELTRQRVRDFGGDFKRMFNQEYRWVHVQMLYDESLQQDSVVLCFKDIDNTKKQELSRMEFMQESLDSVDQMAKSKNIFFSNMSHDMRTPLNGIIGLTNLAMSNLEDPERTKDTFRKIQGLSNQLLTLINDILELSKMEQGKLEIRNQNFNIRENMEELVFVYQTQITDKQKQFDVLIHVDDEWVNSDWSRIQQILDNLLSNAFKFTEENGKIRLQVTEQKDSNSKFGKYQIIVEDDGAGMSRDFLKKIFIPFERETKFGAAKVAGTGLGMPIVHDLVIKMQGTIEVTSSLGNGTTFTVMLPLEICNTDASGNTEQSGEDTTDSVEELDGNGRKVLIAEDNEINMEIGVEILRMFGFEVEQAWNGKEALDLFRESEENEYALIVMDMKMPVMDGCEAARQIRRLNRPDAKTIPIIAATANAFTEDIALTQKAGMNAHISKPIDFDVLKKTIAKLLK
ncbi:response regulator [Drancourtella massiliensis]|uniref:Stage 0 sporulation protein A homolog n=2 Tax=Clostridia TaxID=186801 RepID=A0ABS2ED39_9FIRM|nr:ATP-binding protein [Drancourtella massiliensis]MBM6742896.1 response regulator [Drancourtella massiliensis]